MPAGFDTTVTDTIRAGLDCAAVAAAIGPLPACDAACVELACETSVDASWDRGLSASEAGGFPPGVIKLTVSGAATVDASALVVGLEGSWVGSIQAENASAAVFGSASGQAPPPG